AEPGGLVAEIARARDATPCQIALAWLLQRSPVMLPIPGTGSIEHLEENVAAAELVLDEEELAQLEDAV
ncbi:MAG TPA: aldo/keto reductase, partial [Solirubrobacteraceae bacterium]|nr:aldo/keto reductase [Solirubrobacteraceae bacterium]